MKAHAHILCESPYCHTDPDTGDLTPNIAAHGLLLCYPCRDRLIRQTGELPTVYAGDLEQALATTGRGGDIVSGTAERGLPINEHVADARADIRRHLRDWSEQVVRGKGIAAPGRSELALADFLITHTDWLAARHEAGKYAASAYDTWRQAMRAAYPSGTRRIRLQSWCPMDNCEGEVSALIRPPEHRLPTAISCDLDPGHAWSNDQWKALAPHLFDIRHVRWLAADEVAVLLNRTPNAVHCLAYRRKWPRIVQDGHAWYAAETVAAELPASAKVVCDTPKTG